MNIIIRPWVHHSSTPATNINLNITLHDVDRDRREQATKELFELLDKWRDDEKYLDNGE